MTLDDRVLVTAGRAAQILGLADRRGVHWLVQEQLLAPFTGWRLEGVGRRPQLHFRLVDVRAVLIRRQEHVRPAHRVPKRRTAGTQLALAFPPPTSPNVLPWFSRPRMRKAAESLKQRLEREGRAKVRLDGRPAKPSCSRKESPHVA